MHCEWNEGDVVCSVQARFDSGTAWNSGGQGRLLVMARAESMTTTADFFTGLAQSAESGKQLTVSCGSAISQVMATLPGVTRLLSSHLSPCVFPPNVTFNSSGVSAFPIDIVRACWYFPQSCRLS